jgi:hypothetical protein
MQVLHFTGIHPGATLSAARRTQKPMMGSGTNNHYVSGYFGSCHYYFEFSANNINSK